MEAWLDTLIVSMVIAAAGFYLIRLYVLKRRGKGGGGCGSTSSCGDQCRLVIGKKD